MPAEDEANHPGNKAADQDVHVFAGELPPNGRPGRLFTGLGVGGGGSCGGHERQSTVRRSQLAVKNKNFFVFNVFRLSWRLGALAVDRRRLY